MLSRNARTQRMKAIALISWAKYRKLSLLQTTQSHKLAEFFKKKSLHVSAQQLRAASDSWGSELKKVGVASDDYVFTQALFDSGIGHWTQVVFINAKFISELLSAGSGFVWSCLENAKLHLFRSFGERRQRSAAE